MSYDGLGYEEHIIFTAITEDGTALDDDSINSMLELPASITGECLPESIALINQRKERIAARQQMVEDANKEFYLAECDKLDAYSDDLKEALQREMKELGKLITEKKKEVRVSTHLPLDQIVAMKDEINKLEKKRKQMQRDIYVREDEIDMQKDKLQEEIRQKLNGKTKITHIMTIAFRIE